MKIKIISLVILALSFCTLRSEKASAQTSVSFQVFYDDLSPYGTWVENPQYGYVWVPSVEPGFSPYATNGYWVFTDAGWTWVSNYSWGWAPFHYGRWFYDSPYGYMWVPDNEWGPGWVTWRRSEGYYGWAPIGPGVSISVAYSSSYSVPHERWTFVRGHDFGRRDINNYYVDHSNNTTIINNTTVINNTYVDKSRNVSYNTGPERGDVEKQAGKTFTPVPIKESTKPGVSVNNDHVEMYRPQVQKKPGEGAKPAPAKVSNMKDLKPVEQKPGQSQPNQNAQPSRPGQSQPEERKAQPGKPGQAQPEERKVQPGKPGQPQPGQQTPPGKPGQLQPEQRKAQPGKPGQSHPGQQTPAGKPGQSQPEKGNQPMKPGEPAMKNPGQKPGGEPHQQPVKVVPNTRREGQQPAQPPMNRNPKNSGQVQPKSTPPIPDNPNPKPGGEPAQQKPVPPQNVEPENKKLTPPEIIEPEKGDHKPPGQVEPSHEEKQAPPKNNGEPPHPQPAPPKNPGPPPNSGKPHRPH